MLKSINHGHNTMRVNFNFSNSKEIESGVQILSLVINDELTSK